MKLEGWDPEVSLSQISDGLQTGELELGDNIQDYLTVGLITLSAALSDGCR